jgi:hypothetical protein
MSTFGREADQLAAQRRKLEKQAADFGHALRFAVDLLNDETIADDEARKLAIAALEPWMPL